MHLIRRYNVSRRSAGEQIDAGRPWTPGSPVILQGPISGTVGCQSCSVPSASHEQHFSVGHLVILVERTVAKDPEFAVEGRAFLSFSHTRQPPESSSPGRC